MKFTFKGHIAFLRHFETNYKSQKSILFIYLPQEDTLTCFQTGFQNDCSHPIANECLRWMIEYREILTQVLWLTGQKGNLHPSISVFSHLELCVKRLQTCSLWFAHFGHVRFLFSSWLDRSLLHWRLPWPNKNNWASQLFSSRNYCVYLHAVRGSGSQ